MLHISLTYLTRPWQILQVGAFLPFGGRLQGQSALGKTQPENVDVVQQLKPSSARGRSSRTAPIRPLKVSLLLAFEEPKKKSP